MDDSRGVLLALLVVLVYSSLSLRSFSGGDSLVGVVCLLLAVGTVASLVGWLRPAHRMRPWVSLAVLLLVAAPFVWVYLTR